MLNSVLIAAVTCNISAQMTKTPLYSPDKNEGRLEEDGEGLLFSVDTFRDATEGRWWKE